MYLCVPTAAIGQIHASAEKGDVWVPMLPPALLTLLPALSTNDPPSELHPL